MNSNLNKTIVEQLARLQESQNETINSFRESLSDAIAYILTHEELNVSTDKNAINMATELAHLREVLEKLKG